jgi:hypothetical protein
MNDKKQQQTTAKNINKIKQKTQKENIYKKMNINNYNNYIKIKL